MDTTKCAHCEHDHRDASGEVDIDHCTECETDPERAELDLFPCQDFDH